MESTDIVLMKSVTVSDASTNGGRMSFNQVTSNILNNMFPNITQSERTSGTSKYRKFFFRNKNSSGETAANSRIWISRRSDGGDYFRIKEGTNTDTQTTAEGYTSWLGAGYLVSVFAVDSTSFDAQFDTNDGVYNGSMIRLTDNSGGEEFLTVKSSGGVSWLGNVATVVTTSGAQRTYPVSMNSLVSGVVDLGDLVSSVDNFVETTSSGTFDENDATVNNVGTVEDSWTIQFTSSTAFTATGANSGLVGSGTVSSNFNPVNTAVGTGDYYFSIPSTAWGGTWAIGETVTFDTHHASASVWIKEVVPASTSSQSNNRFDFKLYAEGS